MPVPRLASVKGGSALEKVAMTVACVIGFPQSSNTCTSSVVGQPTVEENELPKLRRTATMVCGVHPAPSTGCKRSTANPAGGGATTTNRTLTTWEGVPSENRN